MIWVVSIVSWLIGLAIFYYVVKAAVRNGILEASAQGDRALGRVQPATGDLRAALHRSRGRFPEDPRV